MKALGSAWIAGALLALAALAPATDAIAQEPGAGELFRRGVEAYRAGNPDGAAALWKQCLGHPLAAQDRARVLYDLGNAAARAARPHEAVGWYEAARRLDPRDADLWANLELARRQAGFAPADRGDLGDTLERLLRSLRAAEAEALALAGVVLLAAALAGEALRGGALWRRLATAAAIALVPALAPWAWQLSRAGSDPVLVVAPEGIALRSEPRADLAPIGRAEGGVELERLDEMPGWVRVEGADGARGWVPDAGVFPLRR